MSERSDIDRLLRHWMNDGPSTMPDRIVDVVADRISVQQQRRSWRLLRRLPMNPLIKLGAAAAAVLVIAVVGWNLLPAGSGPGGPSPTPTPTPIARPSAAASAAAIECIVGTVGCAGALPAGDHRSTTFDPYVTFTTESNLWANVLDVAEAYDLESPDGYLLLWAHPAIVERTAACESTPALGRGNSPADWIDYITNHPGLVASNVQSVVIGGAVGEGGRTGKSVDVTASRTWKPECADDLWTANLVQFIGTSVPSPIDVYGVSSSETARFVFLDVSDQTILVAYYPTSGGFEGSVPWAQRIIDSMRFGCGPAAGRPCGAG